MSGSIPFATKKWQAAVDSRLARVRAGNFGDFKSVGGGVFELRIDLGPGLRVPYGPHGQRVVVFIGGGNKRSQTRDIRRAGVMATIYKSCV